MSVGGEKGRIFERNFDKGRVNEEFKFSRIYAERNKEGLKC